MSNDTSGILGRSKNRITNALRTVKMVGYGLWALVRVQTGMTDEPQDLRCEACGYEGTADKTFPIPVPGAEGGKIGMEGFDGEHVPMWSLTPDETLCHPCWTEAQDSDAPTGFDMGDSTRRLRRLQERDDE